jgi:hypothetical protein
MVVINNLNTIIELLSFTSSFYFVFSLLNWYVIAHLFSYAKSLKITKGQSESVYRRENRQHNDQKKKHKRTNIDQQNIHIKLKIE